MSNLNTKSPELIGNQWDNIPDELKEVYTATTERLYSRGIGGEDVQQIEANIYNSIFGQYGLRKPVHN